MAGVVIFKHACGERGAVYVPKATLVELLGLPDKELLAETGRTPESFMAELQEIDREEELMGEIDFARRQSAVMEIPFFDFRDGERVQCGRCCERLDLAEIVKSTVRVDVDGAD